LADGGAGGSATVAIGAIGSTCPTVTAHTSLIEIRLPRREETCSQRKKPDEAGSTVFA
jgi:hypothetical protein